MDSSEVRETKHLGPEQCGNQTGYGLPWSLYCANPKAELKEWCSDCCKDIRENYPGTDVSRREMPYEMLTFFDGTGKVFVWPQRGQELEEQRGQIWVFDDRRKWARQMAQGVMDLNEALNGGPLAHWDDVVHVYLQDNFRAASGKFHGFDYTMDSLREIASIYGQPVTTSS